jgi:hypothetical protein
MKENKDLIGIYSGTDASVHLLKTRLDRMGISAEIRKDSNAGTWGIVPDNIELYIERSNQKEAESIINEFIQRRKLDQLK